ncbi:hypothetical protein Tco_0807240 [Tanacetum coccineum]
MVRGDKVGALVDWKDREDSEEMVRWISSADGVLVYVLETTDSISHILITALMDNLAGTLRISLTQGVIHIVDDQVTEWATDRSGDIIEGRWEVMIL